MIQLYRYAIYFIDSQVVQLCPGQSAELSCMVSERDSIVWNGTAFTNQCPDTDSISVTRNNTDNSLTTPISCGRFNAENIFVNATDSRFPGVDFTAIMSTLSFMINDTTLSGNTNILCNVDLQDNPNVNATITLYGKSLCSYYLGVHVYNIFCCCGTFRHNQPQNHSGVMIIILKSPSMYINVTFT